MTWFWCVKLYTLFNGASRKILKFRNRTVTRTCATYPIQKKLSMIVWVCDCVIFGFLQIYTPLNSTTRVDTFRSQHHVSNLSWSDFSRFGSKLHMFVWLCDCVILEYLLIHHWILILEWILIDTKIMSLPLIDPILSPNSSTRFNLKL